MMRRNCGYNKCISVVICIHIIIKNNICIRFTLLLVNLFSNSGHIQKYKSKLPFNILLMSVKQTPLKLEYVYEVHKNKASMIVEALLIALECSSCSPITVTFNINTTLLIQRKLFLLIHKKFFHKNF